MEKFEMMSAFYEKYTSVHNYIVGFRANGKIWAYTCDFCAMMNACKLDAASRGAGACIRFKPSAPLKKAMVIAGAVMVTDEATFEELVNSSIYNKGEIFEKLVTEWYGQEWKKDNIPFYQQGDINVNGVEYQIKFEKATITNERQMNRVAGLL